MYNEDGTVNVGRVATLALLATYPWLRHMLLMLSAVLILFGYYANHIPLNFMIGGLIWKGIFINPPLSVVWHPFGMIALMFGSVFLFCLWLPAVVIAAVARKWTSAGDYDD